MDERELRALAYDHRLRGYAGAQMEVQCRVGDVLSRMKQGDNLLKVGFVRFDDYACEVTGLRVRAALQLVWLHRKLPQYPCIEKAWMEGRIYLSQVILLMQRIKPDEEAVWVERAARLTVRALLQALDGERPLEEVDARPGYWLQVPASPRARAEWQVALEIASRLVGRDALPWECLDIAIMEMMAGPMLHPGVDLGNEEKVDLEGWRRWQRDEAARIRNEMEEAREEEAGAWAHLPSDMPTCEVPAAPGPDADAFELDTYLRRLMTWSLQKERALVEGLGRFNRQELWRELNFLDVEHYAAERLGMRRSQVGDILYICRRLPLFPEVAAAFEDGELSRTQVRMLLRIVAQVTAAEWVAYAKKVTARELSSAVEKGLLMLKEHPFRPVYPPDLEAEAAAPVDFQTFAQRDGKPSHAGASDIQTSAEGDQVNPAGSPGESEIQTSANADGSNPAGSPGGPEIQTSANDDGPNAAGTPVVSKSQTSAPGSGVRVPTGFFVEPGDLVGSLRLWVPSELEAFFEEGFQVARYHLGAGASLGDCFQLIVCEFLKEWAPVAARAAKAHRVPERDEWRCQVPGCSNREHLEVHHVQYRSHGGALESWNEVTLCRAHHLKSIHEGYISVRGRAPHGLTWVLGVMPDGTSYQVFDGRQRVA